MFLWQMSVPYWRWKTMLNWIIDWAILPPPPRVVIATYRNSLPASNGWESEMLYLSHFLSLFFFRREGVDYEYPMKLGLHLKMLRICLYFITSCIFHFWKPRSVIRLFWVGALRVSYTLLTLPLSFSHSLSSLLLHSSTLQVTLVK